MDFERWRQTERKAFEAIRDFAAMGIPIDRGTPCTTAGILNWQRGRAKDAANLDSYDSDDRDGDITPAHLAQMAEWLRRYLNAGRGSSDDMKFAKRLCDALDGFLNRNADGDSIRGRAQRDMDSSPSQNAFRDWEEGATSEDRAHLAESRRLAARAADSRPLSFLGSNRPVPDTDLERIERQAQATFGLI